MSAAPFGCIINDWGSGNCNIIPLGGGAFIFLPLQLTAVSIISDCSVNDWVSEQVKWLTIGSWCTSQSIWLWAWLPRAGACLCQSPWVFSQCACSIGCTACEVGRAGWSHLQVKQNPPLQKSDLKSGAVFTSPNTLIQSPCPRDSDQIGLGWASYSSHRPWLRTTAPH